MPRHNESKTLKTHKFKSLAIAFFTIFAISIPAFSQPLIGISFPPIKSLEQIAFTIEQLNALDVTYIRIAENWKNREPRQGEFNWPPLEKRINTLSAAGIKILLTVQSDGPGWACAIRNAKSCEFKDWQDFEPYMKGVLERVGAKLDAIQFGNEWDNQFVGSAAQFLEFQNSFYDLVKQYRPRLKVVLGGITSRTLIYDAMCIGNIRLDQSDYQTRRKVDLNQFIQSDICTRQRASYASDLQDVRNVLTRARYDIADIHLYDTPDLWAQFTDRFSTMTTKPIYVTEFGGPNPELELSNPEYQASRLKTYLQTVSQLPIERAYYFKLTDGDAYHGLSGLFDEQGNRKPAYDVFLNR